MFAGQMRLRTFLIGAGVLGVGALGLAGWGAAAWMGRPEEPAPVLAPPAASVEALAAPAAELPPGVRPFDLEVIARLGHDLGAEKIKDVLRGGPKVNLYQDAGSSTANRAKIDLDRDDKDDEKWTIDGRAIKRQVSPDDDERYTETFLWTGDRWVRDGEGGSTPQAPPAVGRPVDADVLVWRGRDLGTDKRKDVTSGKPYKVNVYQDAGNATANRAKVDLDRDDKWDEKITFEADRVVREVAPADDEQYTETYTWDGSGWKPGG
ncbi:MAG TPA: hypothetical protein PKA64_16360 [Myxococcota bacterium]|nr:hypothetical protein [Myxococcota bacterium]